MNVVLINQFFWPDMAATSQLLTDLARHLCSQGHEVTVICASSRYADREATDDPRAHIIRVPNLGFGRDKFSRLLSYGSFLLGALWKSMRVRRPDLVVTLTTPPLLSIIGLLLQRRGCQHHIWEMDMYPDIAVGLHVMRRNSRLTAAVSYVADYCRKRADGVVVLGDCMRQRLIEHGIDPARITVAENWANGSLLRPVTRGVADVLTTVYAGNFGLPHDVETIAGAINRMKDDPHLRFLFVGGGSRSSWLQEFCRRNYVPSASFLPYCDRERLNELLACADIGLVTQTSGSLGCLVPSKIYSMLAAGLPILYIGPPGATAAQLVRRFGCGWCYEEGDVDGIVELFSDMLADRSLVRHAGAKARDAFLSNYDTPIGVERVCVAVGLAEARRAHA